jgi:hypothetical protein
LEWRRKYTDFASDGGLRHIYVFEATLRDWQAVLDAVRKFQPPPTYIINGEGADMPISAEHI